MMRYTKFAEKILNAKLDDEMKRVLDSFQVNQRTAVASGTSRGKDFLAATAAICYLYLEQPSIVLLIAPTRRQTILIMMREIKQAFERSGLPFEGEVGVDSIRFFDKTGKEDPKRFLKAFKPGDKKTENWTGYHAPKTCFIVTEASGLPDEVFDTIDTMIQNKDCRLLIVFNPNRRSGETYRCSKSPLYKFFQLNSLNAPNVKARKTLIPGQVTWEFIDTQLKKASWASEIEKEAFDRYEHIKWETFDELGNPIVKYYEPTNIARVRILGRYPNEESDSLIPYEWFDMANERWLEWNNGEHKHKAPIIGADLAGEGRNSTVFAYRSANVIIKLKKYPKIELEKVVDYLYEDLKTCDYLFVDAIGEGSSASQMIRKKSPKQVTRVKWGAPIKKKDSTGTYTFANQRAYCYWMVREALDPKLNGNLALPPDDDLRAELTSIKYEVDLKGVISIESKRKMKIESPDSSDAIALTYFPYRKDSGSRQWA